MLLFNLIHISEPLCNLIVGVISLWLVKYLWSTIKRIRSLPPGPWGLPVVGYFPFIWKHNYLQFDKLSRRYGKVFSVKLGHLDVVLVCDWEHLKEALANDSLLGRPKGLIIPGIIDHPSFVEMSDEPWRHHRRLSLHVLRDVGFGKSELETHINSEIDNFCDIIEKEPVRDFVQKLLPSISNNVSFLLFGHYYDRNDPDKILLDDSIIKLSPNVQFAGVAVFLPWIVRLLVIFKRANFDLVAKVFRSFDEAVQKEIDKHQERYEPGRVVDYIDGYLNEQSKRKSQDDGLLFNIDTLRRNVSGFFGAGTETVTTTLSWALMYLIVYPKYQDKIFEEINEVIGFDRKPDYSHRNRMPITMAFIYEVHRLGSVLASNLLRRATCDTKIGNHSIPKDTIVIFNFWSVHMNPNLWDNPEEFNPSRFLSEDGSKAVKPQYLVPFSGGKRICPGESLANVEIFLYIVSIVQRFKIRTEPGTRVSLEADFGLSRRPKDIPVLIFEKR
ncbi:cytochrome P450 2J2-like [Panonychus citri]|uniref:cytochrome P450 2J2-like n=1 Tax=Panonychus citri TaxID=50023 RepID=UPI00230815A4|nr:cytochrome P450 2J2-like [Panonychus citri]